MNQDFFYMDAIDKEYDVGGETMRVLKNVSLSIEKGEFLSVLGPSGSGKSTLMNLIGCLDMPTRGEYWLQGQNVCQMNQHQLAQLRCHEVGFIFQSFQLMPRLTALRNVELPLIYAGISKKNRMEMAKEQLIHVGLEERMDYYPNQLSGGQQQRVAIARALASDPSILLADEPTGALDQKTGHQVMELFLELHNEGRTIIMITHDVGIAKNASRMVRILDGRLLEGGQDVGENA